MIPYIPAIISHQEKILTAGFYHNLVFNIYDMSYVIYLWLMKVRTMNFFVDVLGRCTQIW